MLKSNEYFYEDEYMYFTFNGIHSSQYNLIIQNDKERTLFVDRGTKIDFAQPKYQSGQHLLGVSHPQRQFSLKLLGSGLNSFQIERILKWLQPGATGNLAFDHSKGWEYDVVVQTVKNPTCITVDYNLYDIVIDITFVTVENSLARNAVDGIATIVLSSPSQGCSNQGTYNLPIFSYNCGPDASGVNKIELLIHHLGNEKVEISLKGEINGLGPRSQKSMKLYLHDIYDSYTGAFLYTKESYFTPQTLILQYNAHNNLYMINNCIGEEYINSTSGILKAKSTETESDDSYSYFIYNKSSMALISPGSPVLLNQCSVQEIQKLMETYHSWFICETANVESNLKYYIPSSFATKEDGSLLLMYDKDYINAGFKTLNQQLEQVIMDLADAKEKNHNLYFGFYHSVTIETDFNKITPIITQYNLIV